MSSPTIEYLSLTPSISEQCSVYRKARGKCTFPSGLSLRFPPPSLVEIIECRTDPAGAYAAFLKPLKYRENRADGLPSAPSGLQEYLRTVTIAKDGEHYRLTVAIDSVLHPNSHLRESRNYPRLFEDIERYRGVFYWKTLEQIDLALQEWQGTPQPTSRILFNDDGPWFDVQRMSRKDLSVRATTKFDSDKADPSLPQLALALAVDAFPANTYVKIRTHKNK